MKTERVGGDFEYAEIHWMSASNSLQADAAGEAGRTRQLVGRVWTAGYEYMGYAGRHLPLCIGNWGFLAAPQIMHAMLMLQDPICWMPWGKVCMVCGVWCAGGHHPIQ